MKPFPFRYVRPSTVVEAVVALAVGDAVVLAGGQSLVPLMNLRLTRPRTVVDINRVVGLDLIIERDGQVVVGATARQADVLASGLVRAKAPLVAAALAHVSHVQVRTRGTVVGNLVHHDPASELPAVALALDAEFTLAARHGQRRVSAAEFFVGEFATATAADELVVEVCFPSAPPGAGAAFHEITRKARDWPLLGAAAQLSMRDGEITEARVAVCGVAATPVRQDRVEAALVGQPAAPSVMLAASAAAHADVAAHINARSSADYRRRVLPVVVRRALVSAFESALDPARSERAREGAA
jgi:carbon-monoxide dehydrogenase medium subunit